MTRTFIALIFVLLLKHSASAQEHSEYSIKAAFVLNFLKFTEFGLANNSPIQACFLGSKEVYSDFLGIDSKTVEGHQVMLRHAIDLANIKECAVVFLADSSPITSGDLIKAVSGNSILTVGEKHDFLEQGGMIKLIVDSGRVRFAISPNRVKEAGLSLSSKLLMLAEIWKS